MADTLVVVLDVLPSGYGEEVQGEVSGIYSTALGHGISRNIGRGSVEC